MDHTVADNILQQLGGGRFKVMTGATNFVSFERGLQFFIPQTRGIRKVVITLQDNDLYSIYFYGVRGLDSTLKASSHDVYFDRLKDLFKEQTGLDTSL